MFRSGATALSGGTTKSNDFDQTFFVLHIVYCSVNNSLMKIAFFSTQLYDKKFFDEHNASFR
ncbi:MAG TPA: hypothetical protein PKU83_09905, partial [Chryseolinea sp.]|nr:hypothetical protein [Chryseolinea sp.]